MDETIDVSKHRNSNGELYYPNSPWGIHLNQNAVNPAVDPINVCSCVAKKKSEAMEKAQQWCDRDGRHATIFRRRDGIIAMRYWYDAALQQIQFMEY